MENSLPFVWQPTACIPEPSPWIQLVGSTSILAVVSDLDRDGIETLQTFLSESHDCSVRLVVVLYPACPTTDRVLDQLLDSSQQLNGKLQCALLPDGPITTATRTTVLLAPSTTARSARLWVGNSGNFGIASRTASRLHVISEPEPLLQDRWLGWFAGLWEASAPLTATTVRIPRLSWPKGDAEAGILWEEYARLCRELGGVFPQPEQEQVKTPEQQQAAEQRNEAAVKKLCEELEIRKPDPLATRLAEFYKKGRLVTVDKTGRVPPLKVPVNTRLLGVEAEKTFGSATRRIDVKIEILDDAASKEIDEQRNVSKILQRFSFPLADGARWVPSTARPLLDSQIARIEAKVQKRVRELVGSDAGEFAVGRRQKIREALDGVYKEFNVGGKVGDDVVETIIGHAAERLEKALGARFLPQLSYNEVWFDPSPASVHDSPWPQARNILTSVATYFRKAVTNQFFFLGSEVTEEELLTAMDVCGDWIAKDPWRPATKTRAKTELKRLEEIGASGLDARDQCQEILAIIEGKPTQPRTDA
jgi:hypothetical protein